MGGGWEVDPSGEKASPAPPLDDTVTVYIEV